MLLKKHTIGLIKKYKPRADLRKENIMLFHTSKLPAEIRISHLNARINEQRKKIAQTTASKFELLQLTQQLSKEARARKKTNEKIYSISDSALQRYVDSCRAAKGFN